VAITNGYCTLTEIKAALGVGDTDDDTALERAVTTASRQIDRWCGRRFWTDDTDTDRYYTATDFQTVVFRGDPTSTDAASITTVAVDWTGNGTYTDLPASAWQAWPRSAAAANQPYTGVKALAGRWFPTYEDAVKVTGTFGWSAVPAEVTEACLLHASRLFKRVREDPLGGGQSSVFGETMPARYTGLDMDVRMMLAPFRKPLV